MTAIRDEKVYGIYGCKHVINRDCKALLGNDLITPVVVKREWRKM